MRKVVLALIVAALAVVTAATAVAGSNSLDPRALTQARKIKAEITARYVRPEGPKLAVTEASPTGVIESYLLLTADFLGLRVVPADNGIHYAICPVRATCPYPGPRCGSTGERLHRLAGRPSSSRCEHSSRRRRRSSPSRFPPASTSSSSSSATSFGQVDMAALAKTLSRQPARSPPPRCDGSVDEITRPRLFVPLGLEPTPERTSSHSVRCRSGRSG